MKVRRKNYRKPKNGQALLLNILWRRNGGPLRVSQTIGVKWFKPGNWCRDGRVPIEHVKKVAAKLKVSPWGLNYQQLKQFNVGSDVPTWKEVVKLYKLSRDEEKEVMELGEP